MANFGNTHRTIRRSDLQTMKVECRKLIRQIVSAPGHSDWSGPGHEILHEWNLRAQFCMEAARMKCWSRVWRVGWRVLLTWLSKDKEMLDASDTLGKSNFMRIAALLILVCGARQLWTRNSGKNMSNLFVQVCLRWYFWDGPMYVYTYIFGGLCPKRATPTRAYRCLSVCLFIWMNELNWINLLGFIEINFTTKRWQPVQRPGEY